jgi:phosphoglycolate phosphatase-like HAD superfamily hydrolase
MVRREHVEPLPGAETTFAALRAAGVRVCLVTHLSRSTLDHFVDVLGWRDLVDVTLAPDPDDDLRGAPFPDLLFAAALRVRVDDIREVAVAGSSVDDLVAGRRAGAAIVAAVADGEHHQAILRAAPHTHVLRAIDEFPAVVAYSSSGGGR